VPKCSGKDKAVPLHEFFEFPESTARFGNWSQDDLIIIAAIKLTDVAKVFYSETIELHDKNIKWTGF
jgi:hypothetical protein